MPIIPIDNKKADKISALSKSIKNRENRIREQHKNIIALDVNLSDDPLIPTTKKMLDMIVKQELNDELQKKFKEILNGE